MHGDNDSYTGENIKVLEGLEAVRLRPAMYIGSTGEMGLHHLVYEVVDNSVDEALAGYCKKIDVVIHVDNSITVVDDGRGIPVDMMDLPGGQRMPAVQVVLTKLHAGGKFDASTYKVSGGLHGVGVSCVNALSQEFNVEIWRDGHTWEMDFSCGIPTCELTKAGTSKRRGTQGSFPRPTKPSSPPPSSTTTHWHNGFARWPSSTRVLKSPSLTSVPRIPKPENPGGTNTDTWAESPNSSNISIAAKRCCTIVPS